MRVYASLLASALAVVSGGKAVVHEAAEVDTASEVYVAQMDQDWNVAGAVRDGHVAVTDVVEDADGHVSPRFAGTIGLDRRGFGAGYQTAALSAGAGPIVLMAVQVPGWIPPAGAEGRRPYLRTKGRPGSASLISGFRQIHRSLTASLFSNKTPPGVNGAGAR